MYDPVPLGRMTTGDGTAQVLPDASPAGRKAAGRSPRCIAHSRIIRRPPLGLQYYACQYLPRTVSQNQWQQQLGLPAAVSLSFGCSAGFVLEQHPPEATGALMSVSISRSVTEGSNAGLVLFIEVSPLVESFALDCADGKVSRTLQFKEQAVISWTYRYSPRSRAWRTYRKWW